MASRPAPRNVQILFCRKQEITPFSECNWRWGGRKEFSERPVGFAQFYGHLFINMTGNLVAAPYVLGMSAEGVGINYCGHVVPELKSIPPNNILRRLVGVFLFLRY